MSPEFRHAPPDQVASTPIPDFNVQMLESSLASLLTETRLATSSADATGRSTTGKSGPRPHQCKRG